MTVGAVSAPLEARISPTTSGRPFQSTTSAAPPAPWTYAATHLAAVRTSGAWVASALMLGIAISSASSDRSTGGTSIKKVRKLVGAFVLAALVSAASASAVDRAHWINAISIDRAELGWPARDYELLFGPAARNDRTLVFKRRSIVVYLNAQGRGVGVLTRDRRDTTLDRIGPCSTESAFRKAYAGVPEAN